MNLTKLFVVVEVEDETAFVNVVDVSVFIKLQLLTVKILTVNEACFGVVNPDVIMVKVFVVRVINIVNFTLEITCINYFTNNAFCLTKAISNRNQNQQNNNNNTFHSTNFEN